MIRPSEAYLDLCTLAGVIHRLRQRAEATNDRLYAQAMKDRATLIYHEARALELAALPYLYRDGKWIIDAELEGLKTREIEQ